MPLGTMQGFYCRKVLEFIESKRIKYYVNRTLKEIGDQEKWRL